MTGADPTCGRRRLIVTADDFGLSQAVNAGIADAIQRGPVRSVSTFVTLPAFDDAIDRARPFSDEVGVGLHFNVLVGAPLTATRSLVNPRTGRFYPFATLVRRALTGRVDAYDVLSECTAQLDRLANALSRAGLGPISHVDSHRHVHFLPAFNASVVAAAQAAGVSHVRVPREPWRYNPLDIRATAKKATLAAMTRGTRTRSHFVGVSLQGGSHFEGRLLALLDRLPDGTTELMVHPAFPDRELWEIDSYTWQRDIERRVLISDAVRERIGRGDIVLTRFAR